MCTFYIYMKSELWVIAVTAATVGSNIWTAKTIQKTHLYASRITDTVEGTLVYIYIEIGISLLISTSINNNSYIIAVVHKHIMNMTPNRVFHGMQYSIYEMINGIMFFMELKYNVNNIY